MISGSRRLTLSQRLVLYGILAVLVLAATFPFYWMLLTSLKTGRAVFDTTQVLLARNLTLRNYVDLFRTTAILRWVWITAALAAASTVIALVIGILSAYSITDFRYRGRKFISFAVFLSYVIPQAMLFIPLFLLLNRMKLVNTFLGLVLAYQTFCVPFCTWLLLGYFRTLPKELKDAALIDGCTPLGVLWRIILPLAAPGVATAAIFSFTQCWNEFLYAASLAQSGQIKTLSLGIAGFLVSDIFIWGQMMAAAFISTVPMLLLFIFLQRFVVQGLTMGAVKG
jgi:ABC-type glycerol-3-phosphate transport system permease component